MNRTREYREEKLRTFLLAAALIDESERELLNVNDFKGSERSVLSCLKDPSEGVGDLDAWLRTNLGVHRKDKEKVIDACKRTLAHDAELGSMESASKDMKWAATMIRFNESCERRRQGMSE